jgi:replicative DNA helicase
MPYHPSMTAAMPDILAPQSAASEAPSTIPHNLEAEQALLGCLLFDNGAYERLYDGLQPRHFYEPFHQRLFSTIEEQIRIGHLAEPIVLLDKFKADQAFQDLGGIRYFADLVDRAPPAANASDYARVIYDLALRRDLIRLGGEIAKAAIGEKDAREQIEAAESQLFAMAETGSSSTGFVTFSDAVAGALNHAEEAFHRDGGLAGVSTGLIDLDKQIGGLHKSDLIILAGRPSMGKTALATNIAMNIAKNFAYEPQPDGTRKTVRGGIVAFYSLEMSADQLAGRLLSDASSVPSDKIRKGEINPGEFLRIKEAAMEISACPLYIDDTGGITLAKLTARARRLKRTAGLDCLIVDYLQLVTIGDSTMNRVQEVSTITMGLKTLAKELAIPVIALSQLSRQVESRDDKRPQLSDLRESGSIEQDADIVMFVYRESYYLGRSEPREGTPEHLTWQEEMDRTRGMAEVIIGKQRHGPIGTVRVSFDANTVRFGNLANSHLYESNYE